MSDVRSALAADRARTLASGRGAAGLRGAEEVWDRLAAASDNFTQHRAWARACAEAFPERETRVVAVGDRALVPLARRWPGLGAWEMLGPTLLSSPADFMYSDPDALDMLCAGLARSATALFLDRVHVDSPTLAALRRAYRGRGVLLGFPAPAAPWISLEPPASAPERLFSAHRRKALRHARNRAARLGEIRAQVLSPTPAELPPLLDEFYRVEASGWKGRLGTALAKDPHWGPLVRRYAADAAEQGVLRLGVLRIGGRVAAMDLGIELGRRLWSLKFGYDEAFAHCYPGNLITLEMVRYAYERGLGAYELMGVHAGYKSRWTRSARPCQSVLVYPVVPRSLTAMLADFAYLVRRRLGRMVLEMQADRARRHPPHVP